MWKPAYEMYSRFGGWCYSDNGFLCSYSVEDTTGIWKWFGRTSFAQMLSLVRMPNNCQLNIVPSYVTLRRHFLESFRMTSKPFCRGVAIPPTDSHLCTFLATVETPYAAEHNAGRCFLSTNCRQPTPNMWGCNVFFTQEPRGLSLPMVIAFHFSTPVPALLPPDLVMMQQFFTDVHD
jgi:hypothetical protein